MYENRSERSLTPMTSTAIHHLSISYVESDIPEGQTLLQWRRELDAARREQRLATRRPSLRSRLRFVGSTP
jgi:hypothetical protein